MLAYGYYFNKPPPIAFEQLHLFHAWSACLPHAVMWTHLQVTPLLFCHRSRWHWCPPASPVLPDARDKCSNVRTSMWKATFQRWTWTHFPKRRLHCWAVEGDHILCKVTIILKEGKTFFSNYLFLQNMRQCGACGWGKRVWGKVVHEASGGARKVGATPCADLPPHWFSQMCFMVCVWHPLAGASDLCWPKWPGNTVAYRMLE